MDESLKEDMNKIRLFLEKELEAQAVIISGSRSIGDYKENSDWDIYILTEKDVEFIPKLEGYQLEEK